jgi:hypothetical protein
VELETNGFQDAIGGIVDNQEYHLETNNKENVDHVQNQKNNCNNAKDPINQMSNSLYAVNSKEANNPIYSQVIQEEMLTDFQQQQHNFFLKQRQEQMLKLHLQAKLEALNRLPQFKELSNEKKIMLLQNEDSNLLEKFQLQQQLDQVRKPQSNFSQTQSRHLNESNECGNVQQQMLLQSIQLQQLQQKLKQQKNYKYNRSLERSNQHHQQQQHHTPNQHDINLIQQKIKDLNFYDKVIV